MSARSLLQKLLDKFNVEKKEDLTKEELEVFERYDRILSAREISVDSIKEFCLSQIKLIEEKFAGPETSNDTYLKACLHVYLNIVKAIQAPEAERESLEKHLNQLLNS